MSDILPLSAIEFDPQNARARTERSSALIREFLYHPKTGKAVKVPDIDASGWIAIHGYSTTPITPSSPPVQLDLAPTPIALPPAQAMPSENGTAPEDGAAALAFINSVDKAYKPVKQLMPNTGGGWTLWSGRCSLPKLVEPEFI